MPKQRVQQVARETKNWTGPMALVREVHLSTSTAYQIWNDGNYMPSVDTLNRIAKALGVSLKDLIDDDPPEDSQEV